MLGKCFSSSRLVVYWVHIRSPSSNILHPTWLQYIFTLNATRLCFFSSQRILNKVNGVIWVDSSIRISRNLDVMMRGAVERGGIYLPHTSPIPTFVVTDPRLYDYIPPDSLEREKRVPQKAAGISMIFNTEAVYRKILHWWLLCALDVNCIAPKGHTRRNCFGFQRCIQNGTAVCWRKCHRYDQSALNILYHNYLQGINKTHLIRSGPEEPFEICRRPTKNYRLKLCLWCMKYVRLHYFLNFQMDWDNLQERGDALILLAFSSYVAIMTVKRCLSDQCRQNINSRIEVEDTFITPRQCIHNINDANKPHYAKIRSAFIRKCFS